MGRCKMLLSKFAQKEKNPNFCGFQSFGQNDILLMGEMLYEK